MQSISVEAILSARDAGYKAAMKDAIAQSGQLEAASEKCGASIAKIAVGNVVARGLAAAFHAVTGAIGGAVKRLDTLNNYPKVMQSLGYSADEAQRSINYLSDGIDGLPTTLDGIASSAQMLTASLGDLDAGTKTAVALNDMFLASGNGAEAASRALQQYNQMLAMGKVDQQSWNTLVQVAPGQMKQLAQELLGATANQKDLYEALQTGSLGMEEFNAAVIRLDQKGGQGFASFAEQAKAATGGIGTAWQNVQTAVVKGVATVIDAIDKAAKEATGSGIADGFNALKDGIKAAFDVIAKVAAKVTSVLAPAFQFLGKHMKTVVKIAGTMLAAFAAYKIITGVANKIKAFREIIAGLTKSKLANTAATTAETAAETASAAASGVATGAKVAETAATEGATTAQHGLNAALSANPIGAVIMAITALVSVLHVLADAFSGLTEEEKRAKEAEQAYLDACNETSDAVLKNADSARQNAAAIEIENQKVTDLANDITELNDKEELNAEEKKELASKTAQLNSYVEDLNLEIDKETGKLKESTAAVKNKISAYMKTQKAIAVEENLNEALKAQIDLEAQQAELQRKVADAAEGKLAIQKKEAEWYDFIAQAAGGATYEMTRQMQAYRDGADAAKDALAQNNQAIEENARIIEEWTAACEQAAAERAAAEEAAAKAAAEAERAEYDRRIEKAAQYYVYTEKQLQESLANQSVTLDQLSAKNQETVGKLQSVWQDYADKATDMFNTLSDESTISVDQMIANIQKNQQVISDWGNHMDALRDRFAGLGLDSAILDQLQTMGPEAAGHVAALVQASDEQLGQLATDFANGGTVAVDALGKSLSDGAAANMEPVKGLVTTMGETLSSEVASADWGEIGDDVVEGMAESFENPTAAINAMHAMITQIKGTTKTDLRTGSPSRVYTDFGKDVDTGLGNGMRNNANLPITAMSYVTRGVINAARNGLSQMQSIGVYAMQGFAQGMSAMSGRVMATASRIANSAASTIANALKVSSPSRVLKEIGIWTGKGFVKGLELTERLVERTMDNIAKIASGIAPIMVGDMRASGSMELAFAGGYSTEMDALRAEIRDLKDAIQRQPVQVSTEIDMDSRAVAKATATYTRDELNRQERLANNLKGIKA